MSCYGVPATSTLCEPTSPVTTVPTPVATITASVGPRVLPGPGLALTGGDIAGIVLVGILAIYIGLMFLVAASRRWRRAQP